MGGPVIRLGNAMDMNLPQARLGGDTFWVEAGDGRLAVECIGTGPPVVLLHGWTLDRRMWTMQARSLAHRFTLIAIDRRGFGQSSAPPCRAREEADIDAVADALHIDRFALVGMSQAGATAIRYAADKGDRVRALVLQGVSLAGIPDLASASDRIPLSDYVHLVRTGQLAQMKQHWAGHRLMAGLSNEAIAIGAAMLADYDGRDLLADPAGPSAQLGDVATLAMPVLAVTGDADTLWRRDVTAAIGRTAPMGQTRFIAGGGHLCNLSHPAAFNAALASFLANPLAPLLHAVND